ncbi:MAG: hypothetical protein ABW321_24510 [Polyangiales bacterium]
MAVVNRSRWDEHARDRKSMVCRSLTVVLLCAIASGVAQADDVVDTAEQTKGIAPRIELEVGPQLAWGLGHACRTTPVIEDDAASSAAQSCSSGFGLLGGQVVALLRPLNHWAFGVSLSYDAVLGSHQVPVHEDGTEQPYSRSAVRFAGEVRWYARTVAPSGLYVAFKLGVLWWTDELPDVADDGVTQSAPQLALEIGSVLSPYRGPGITLALQSWLALLRDNPALATRDAGSTYGYGPFVFFGAVCRLQLGIGL